MQLAQSLLEKLKEHPEGKQVINQTVSNVKYAATSGSGPATISNINDIAASIDDFLS